MPDAKKFTLVVDSDAKHLSQLTGLLSTAYPDATVNHETDARMALYKIRNVTPDALITVSGELDKNLTGLQFVESVLQDSNIKVGIVLLAGTQVPESFTSEVLSGRLSICARPIQNAAFLRAVDHALHYQENKTAGSFELHSLKAGEILFNEGDSADLAYLLKSGKLSASQNQDGKSQVLGEILPGEFVGEMAYINGEPRSAKVEALEASELIRIPLNVFESLLFTKPTWSMAMMRTLSKRLKVANKQ